MGYTIGNIVCGICADKYGRKITHITGRVFLALAVLMLSFTRNMVEYSIVQFFVGFMNTVDYSISFVLFQELLSDNRRHYASSFSSIGFSTGMCVLSLIAFLFPDWRSLAQVNAMLQLVLLPISFWLPESPRWLRQNAIDGNGNDNGNIKKAEEIETRIDFYTKTTHKKGILESKNSEIEMNCTKFGVLDLFRTKELRTRSFMLMIIYPVICSLYYCFNLDAGKLDGNIYINGMINGLIEIIIYLISGDLAARFGRRSMLASSFALSAFAALFALTPYINTIVPNDVFGWIGKIGICAAFNQIVIQIPELYPTNMRAIAIGFPNSVARVFTMFSPYFAELKIFSLSLFWVVQLVMISLALVAELMLPETIGGEIPGTLEDVLEQEERRLVKFTI